MGIILIGIGIPLLVVLGMCLAMHDRVSVWVIVSAFCTFLGIWKLKNVLGPEAWSKSRIHFQKNVQTTCGVLLIGFAVISIGVNLETAWQVHLGKIRSHDNNSEVPANVFISIVICSIGLRLIGYQKLPRAMIIGTFLAINLASALVYFLGHNVNNSPMTLTTAYLAVFLTIFITGQYFQWSKGFCLGCLLLLFVAYLSAYLTM